MISWFVLESLRSRGSEPPNPSLVSVRTYPAEYQVTDNGMLPLVVWRRTLNLPQRSTGFPSSWERSTPRSSHSVKP